MLKMSMHGGGGDATANTKPKYPPVANFDIIFYFVISILNLSQILKIYFMSFLIDIKVYTVCGKA